MFNTVGGSCSVLQGDLGTSWRTGIPVLQMILSRFVVTAELTLGAMVVALVFGIPLGILSARRENTSSTTSREW